MRAMILAAGLGTRMGHLTATTPKPLLPVQGRYLIEYNLSALAHAGFHEIVINVSFGAEQIKAALGQGEKWGVAIAYSYESEPLETGGGIFQALPLLGPDPFLVVSADIVTNYPWQQLPRVPQGLAHLVLVADPTLHQDFNLQNGWVVSDPVFTYGNIGVLRPELFAGCTPGKFPLGPLLHHAVAKKQVTGECFTGRWHNLGTPEQLSQLNAVLDSHPAYLLS